VVLWGVDASALSLPLFGRMTAGECNGPTAFRLGVFLAAGGWLVWLYGPLMPALRSENNAPLRRGID